MTGRYLLFQRRERPIYEDPTPSRFEPIEISQEVHHDASLPLMTTNPLPSISPTLLAHLDR